MKIILVCGTGSGTGWMNANQHLTWMWYKIAFDGVIWIMRDEGLGLVFVTGADRDEEGG